MNKTTNRIDWQKYLDCENKKANEGKHKKKKTQDLCLISKVPCFEVAEKVGFLGFTWAFLLPSAWFLFITAAVVVGQSLFLRAEVCFQRELKVLSRDESVSHHSDSLQAQAAQSSVHLAYVQNYSKLQTRAVEKVKMIHAKPWKSHPHQEVPQALLIFINPFRFNFQTRLWDGPFLQTNPEDQV